MKTYIGLDRCTLCGGGSRPCPVCNPVEETKQVLQHSLRISGETAPPMPAELERDLIGRMFKHDNRSLEWRWFNGRMQTRWDDSSPWRPSIFKTADELMECMDVIETTESHES